MNSLVSIVVPVYNVYKYLPECINSILRQSYKNIEVILVDDESPDQSGELCNKYAEKYENVKVVHKKNGGLGFARNTGIENAKGSYITFIDGDDFVGANHIENLVADLLHAGADACYGGYRKQIGEKFISVQNPLKGNIYNGEDIVYEFVPRLCGKLDYRITDDVQMSACMNLYSLDLIKKYNIKFHSERELISEDLIFNIDFLKNATMVCASDSCEYCYRITEGSLTRTYREDRLEKQTEFSRYVIELTKNLGIFERCEQRIYSTYLSWVRAVIQSEQKRTKEIGFKNSISNIGKICNEPFVIEVCTKYDESNLTTKLRLMQRLIKNKHGYLLWLLSFVKNGG